VLFVSCGAGGNSLHDFFFARRLDNPRQVPRTRLALICRRRRKRKVKRTAGGYPRPAGATGGPLHADGFAGASSPACRASSELALRLSGRRRVLVHSPGPRDLCIVCSCSEYILVIVEVLAPPILYIYRKTNRRLFTLPLGYNRRCVFVQMCLCVPVHS
jgi:hypothetical protein